MPKVLVVEDQATVLTIVRYHFESAGFDGVYANDVDEGWRLLVSENPEAVVTDLTLPGADGWTLIERIRKDGRFHRLPIVILTGQQEDETAARASELNCAYLTKPFAASALINKVNAVLKESEQAQHRPPPPLPGTETRQIQMVPVGVIILMDHFQIEGTIYLPPELSRFSDAWESVVRDQRAFFPVTNARVTKGAQVVNAPFMEVRKSGVRAVFPLDIPSE